MNIRDRKLIVDRLNGNKAMLTAAYLQGDGITKRTDIQRMHEEIERDLKTLELVARIEDL